MKQSTLIIFVMLAIFGFLIWNRVSSVSETFVDVSVAKSVEPATIQTIVNSIQARIPDLYPLQTVYINPLQGSQGSMVYNARILFLNTRGYFGVQYDVQADSNGNLLSVTGQVQPQVNGPFQGFDETTDLYQDFESVEAVLEQQFADLKSKSPDVAQKLDTWLDIQRAQQRGRALSDAQTNSMPAGGTDASTERAMISK